MPFLTVFLLAVSWNYSDFTALQIRIKLNIIFFFSASCTFFTFYCINLLPRPGRDECDEPDFINIKVRVAWWARGNFSNIATTRQNFCDTIKCENVRPLSLLCQNAVWTPYLVVMWQVTVFWHDNTVALIKISPFWEI